MSDPSTGHLDGPPAPTVWPTVGFTDVDAGVRFLTEGLGFVVTAMYHADDGTVEHAEARWPDGGGVMFGSRGKPGHWGALGPQGVYVVATEAGTVDAAWHRVRTMDGVEALHELHDTDYGSHQFDVRDADGNLWVVGTYRGAGGAGMERLASVGVERTVPDLASQSLDTAKRFYADVLGLEPVMDHGWIVTLAAPREPTAQLSLLTHDATAPVVPEASIQVDDVDLAFAAAVRAGAEVVHPLTDEPWGVRRFFVRDPDGHVLNVLSHR